MRSLYILGFIMVGVMCVLGCLGAAIKKPFVAVLGLLTYFGFIGYMIYYFWAGAWPILNSENKAEYPNDPGFQTFVLWALLYLSIVGQACGACACCMLCCTLATGGTAALSQYKAKMGGGDDHYSMA